MNHVLVLVSVFISILIASPRVNAATTAEWCHEQWTKISSQHSAASTKDLNALLSAWQKHEKQCQGTGTYETRLATIFVMMGKYDRARKVLAPVRSDPSLPASYRAMAEMVMLNADSREMLTAQTSDKKGLEDLGRRAEKLIAEHPNYPPFYQFLGNLRMKLGDYKGAIGPLERMSQFPDGKRWDVYRHLTVAHGNEGNYQKALGFGDMAYGLNKALTSDEEFMYALALSYAATGKVDAAKDALTLILNKKPSLSSDKKFQEVVQKAKELSGGKLK